jgi:Zn-dependent peptidase ImmA (M78 family)
MPVILEGLLHTDDETFSDEKDTAEVAMNDAVPATYRMSIEQMEQEANAFAAALLVPEVACRKLYEMYQLRYGNHRTVLARRMATDFLVSRFAMHRRLETLGLGKA